MLACLGILKLIVYLFETELQFHEKIKPQKYFFVWICTLFAKNTFFGIWVSLVYGIRDGNPVPRTVQMTFLQLIRLVHNESSLI